MRSTENKQKIHSNFKYDLKQNERFSFEQLKTNKMSIVILNAI